MIIIEEKKEKELNKRFYLRNAVMFCLMLLFTVLDMIFSNIIFKGLASACFVITGIISIMTGKAVSLEIALKNKLTLILCIGSIAFFISDIMVLLTEFSPGNNQLFLCICHCIYYPAQFVLAQALSSRSSNVSE